MNSTSSRIVSGSPRTAQPVTSMNAVAIERAYDRHRSAVWEAESRAQDRRDQLDRIRASRGASDEQLDRAEDAFFVAETRHEEAKERLEGFVGAVKGLPAAKSLPIDQPGGTAGHKEQNAGVRPDPLTNRRQRFPELFQQEGDADAPQVGYQFGG